MDLYFVSTKYFGKNLHVTDSPDPAVPQLERENIKFRLNSGRKLYIERGGKLGRKVGSIKTMEQKKEEHHDIISYLKRGYSIRNIAKLTGKGISTVQRIKADFNL